MTNVKKAIEMIDNAISMIHEELDRADAPHKAYMSKTELRSFLTILELMKRKLMGHGDVDESRIYNMGHIIADSWPFSDLLGETIIRAEQEYVKTLKRLMKGHSKLP